LASAIRIYHDARSSEYQIHFYRIYVQLITQQVKWSRKIRHGFSSLDTYWFPCLALEFPLCYKETETLYENAYIRSSFVQMQYGVLIYDSLSLGSAFSVTTLPWAPSWTRKVEVVGTFICNDCECIYHHHYHPYHPSPVRPRIIFSSKVFQVVFVHLFC